MHQVKIDKIGPRSDVIDPNGGVQRQRRLHLFTHSRFEDSRQYFSGIGRQDLSALKSGSGDSRKNSTALDREAEEIVTIRLPTGEQLELPRMAPNDRARLDALLSGLTPEQQEYLTESGNRFGSAAYAEALDDNPQPPYALATTSAGQQSYEAYMMTTAQQQQDAARTDAMLFGLAGVESDLYTYFNRIRDQQAIAGEVRADIAELNSMLADWPDDGSTELFSYREVKTNKDGAFEVIEHVDVELTKSEAQALLQRLEVSEQGLGDFDTMAMFHLQHMVHKYQQATTVVSNIMKNMDETHKGIIQNVR